jgi:hypothetical protein
MALSVDINNNGSQNITGMAVKTSLAAGFQISF